jgi:hypothetical protein
MKFSGKTHSWGLTYRIEIQIGCTLLGWFIQASFRLFVVFFFDTPVRRKAVRWGNGRLWRLLG